MNPQKIKLIISVIAMFCEYDEDEITPDMHLISEMKYDSLRLMELIVKLEDEFEIEMVESAISVVDDITVQDIIAMVDMAMRQIQ